MVKRTESLKISAWWKYNPILQKPTSLDPVRPWSWYYYYGPDPAAGCSYGQYHDEDYGFDILTEKANMVYSPATGKPMTFISDVPVDEVEQKMRESTGNSAHSRTECSGCGTTITADFDLDEPGELHCFRCGDVLRQLGINTEGKTMRTASVSKNERLKKLQEKVRANLLAKAAAETTGVEAEVTAAAKKEARVAEIRAKIVARRAERAKEKEAAEAAKKDEDEWIPLDRIVAAMEEVEKEEDAALQQTSEDEACLEEAKEDDKGDDEYIDIDMVLSALKRKELLAKKAAVKARIKARLAAKAAEEAAEEAPVAAEPDMIAQENPVPEDVAPAAEAPAPELKEEAKEDEAAMKYEPLASLASLKNVKKDQIEMLLYAEHTDNPFWNVMVAGTPVARIQLQKQMAPEEIKAVFVSDGYAEDLAEHCEKTGFLETMKKVSAELWANYTSNEKVAAHYRTEASTKFESERKKLLASFKTDFVACLGIVQAGLTKNFYPDLGNPLKHSLFANLTLAGLPEETAASAIEKSFAEGSAEYFRSLFDKSEEYMSLTKEARAEIARAIGNSSSLNHLSGDLSNTPVTLADRVAQASVIAQLSGPSLHVKPVTMDTDAYKAQVRAVWRK